MTNETLKLALDALEEIDGAVLGILGLIVSQPGKDSPADKVRSAIIALRSAIDAEQAKGWEAGEKSDSADRHDAPDNVEVTYLVWPHDRHGGWQEATREQYDRAMEEDRMAVVSLESYLTKELRNARIPVAYRSWSDLLGYGVHHTLKDARRNSVDGFDPEPLCTTPPAQPAREWAGLTDEWTAAFSAFTGAFDTPLSRRRADDEFCADARRRLRDFNDKMVGLKNAGQPVVKEN